MDLVEKTIVLANGDEYIVADTVVNNNKTYLLLGKVIPNQEDVEDEFKMAELNNNVVTVLEDKALIESLKKVFEFNLEQ